MKLQQWIERTSALLTLGLLALIAYEQSATVARLAALPLRVSALKHFVQANASVRIPPASRQPRRPPAPAWLPSGPSSPRASLRAPEHRLASNDTDAATSAPLVTHLRVGPDTVAGTPVGVRLIGIRPDTLLGLLGFENGDRLESINGFPVATPEQALLAYAQLRSASQLAVAINRRGKPLVIHYELV